MYNNASVFYITTKKSAKITALLSQYLPKRFKHRGQCILNAGGVWFNRKRVLTDRIIPEQGTLKVYVTEKQDEKYVLSKDQILFENNDFLILIKPPGVNSISDRSHLFWNITYGVKAYLMSQNSRYDPQPMTRLDLMVSGLMLFSKNKKSEKVLFNMTQNRKIKKIYHAYLEEKSDMPFCLRVQDKLSFIKKAKVDEDGKNAHSLFIKHKDGNAGEVLYSVVIFTGRRHQIRCHCSSYLSPIIGDKYYGSNHSLEGQNIKLISYGLNFFYQGEKFRFRLPS